MSIDAAREQQDEEGERARQRVHSESLPECRPLFNECEIENPAPSSWIGISEANTLSDVVEGPLTDKSVVGRVFHHEVGVRYIYVPADATVARPCSCSDASYRARRQ